MPKPKYNREELRQMASETLKAKGQGDPKFGQLIEEMMRRTGLTAEEVEFQIFELAIGL